MKDAGARRERCLQHVVVNAHGRKLKISCHDRKLKECYDMKSISKDQSFLCLGLSPWTELLYAGFSQPKDHKTPFSSGEIGPRYSVHGTLLVRVNVLISNFGAGYHKALIYVKDIQW